MNKNRTKNDLEEQLKAQLHLLRKSAHEFDGGDIDEFRNIARALRVIVAADDHGNPSLIELATTIEVELWDTRMVAHPRSLSPSFSLAGIVLGPQTVGCRAFLDDAPHRAMTKFGSWLVQEVVDDKAGGTFNRIRLIKAIANLAGGTHYPPDVRDYFKKLQSLSVTASRRNKNIEQKYSDIEKHSLRQIAHEVIKSFDDSYERKGQFEIGSLMIGPGELIPYPGRKLTMSVIANVKKGPAIFLSPPPHGFTGIGGPVAKLPYEGVGRKALCPCGSGLQFRNCCIEPHDLPEEIIERFEKHFKLGKYREKLE